MNISRDTDVFASEIQEKILNDYKEFQSYQQETVETLRVFHEICKRNGIPYYLMYGSILGAVRHNGQIPWDYDIDVGVPAEYAEKLIDALKEQLPSEYHYGCRIKDKSYRAYSLRLSSVKYDLEVLHVDVFWITGFDMDAEKQKKLIKKKQKYTQIMMYKYCPLKYLTGGGKISLIYNGLKKLKAKLYPDSVLDGFFEELLSHPVKGAKQVSEVTAKYVLDACHFTEPVPVTLESGFEVYMPNDPEKLLTVLYGDYKAIPSIESRMHEFTTALSRIRALGKNENR